MLQPNVAKDFDFNTNVLITNSTLW